MCAREEPFEAGQVGSDGQSQPVGERLRRIAGRWGQLYEGHHVLTLRRLHATVKMAERTPGGMGEFGPLLEWPLQDHCDVGLAIMTKRLALASLAAKYSLQQAANDAEYIGRWQLGIEVRQDCAYDRASVRPRWASVRP